jgi:hypothetical protein
VALARSSGEHVGLNAATLPSGNKSSAAGIKILGCNTSLPRGDVMTARVWIIVCLLAVAGCGEPGRPDLASSLPVAEPAADEQHPAGERRIIYTATIDLVVKDFAQTQETVKSLVAKVKGYVATFREDSPYPQQRGGKWVVRLPAAEFERFTSDVLTLGIITSQQSEAQDVTEQYIDLTARLANKKRMEERVLKLLEEKTGQIKEVIEVETQLARIREDIETLEGKVRYLSDRVAMTTVTISVRENAAYFPDAPPTFASKAWNTLSQSLAGMQQVGAEIALAVIAISPWLLLGIVVLGPTAVVCVRLSRRVRYDTSR